MSYFTFKGISSANYGILKSVPYPVRSERNITVTDIPDGDPIIQSSGYKTSQLAFRLGIKDNSSSNINAIYSWLTGSGQLILSSDTSKYMKAYCSGPISPEYISKRLGEVTLNFIVEPYRYAVNNPSVAVSLTEISGGTQKSGSITNAGTADCNPIYEVTTSGDFTLWINSTKYINVESGAGTFKINLQNKRVFDSSNNIILEKVTGDPTALMLKPGNNSINVTSVVSAVSVFKNERWY